MERDFDAQTERHKKIIESYQAELDSVDKFREQSRQALEKAMMSEFETYNGKVYDEANKLYDSITPNNITYYPAQLKKARNYIKQKDYNKNRHMIRRIT